MVRGAADGKAGVPPTQVRLCPSSDTSDRIYVSFDERLMAYRLAGGQALWDKPATVGGWRYSRQSAAMATKRFKASLAVPGSVFMLTRAPEGKGNVLLQIDKRSAPPLARVDLGKEREPVYAVDDIAGMLFLRTAPGTVIGYRLWATRTGAPPDPDRAATLSSAARRSSARFTRGWSSASARRHSSTNFRYAAAAP